MMEALVSAGVMLASPWETAQPPGRSRRSPIRQRAPPTAKRRLPPNSAPMREANPTRMSSPTRKSPPTRTPYPTPRRHHYPLHPMSKPCLQWRSMPAPPGPMRPATRCRILRQTHSAHSCSRAERQHPGFEPATRALARSEPSLVMSIRYSLLRRRWALGGVFDAGVGAFRRKF